MVVFKNVFPQLNMSLYYFIASIAKCSCTSEGEMLNTSAILAYSSLTLVNP